MECPICPEINLGAPYGSPRVSYGISLLSVWRQYLFRCKIGAQFTPNTPQSEKPFWTNLLVLLGEEAQVEARFGLFLDSANLNAR